ncbi:MAG TPA: cytosine permease [Gaiellaceae bacterium]|nr:cytosine permease [Gaiellaceae bacterium]
MKTETPTWGIEPVPDRLRVLGVLDLTMLWGNLGVSLLVLVIGALLVPALSLRDALIAVVVGSVIGNAMLGVAGLIGADGRVPSMVLLRAPLGRRGSYLPTLVNVLQCLGWATFELIIIAAAAAALSDEVFGFRATWAWTIFFGGASAVLALMGPIGVVRRFLRRFALWAVLASLAYLTWWTLAKANLGDLWAAKGEGGMSIWLGIDLVIAVTVSWVPLVADYTRFARDRRAALVGSGLGYFLGATWILAVGVVFIASRDVSDPVGVPAAVAAGGLAAALALLAVTVDETDEAFANIYSTAVSVQNLLPRVSQRLLIVLVSAVATAGALTIELRSYESFLLLLGSAFVPLFGVLLGDWLVAGTRYSRHDIFGATSFRPGLLFAWLVGFALYHWLHEPPLGPSWWANVVEETRQPGVGIGASLPSFAAAFVVAAVASTLERRRGLPVEIRV